MFKIRKSILEKVKKRISAERPGLKPENWNPLHEEFGVYVRTRRGKETTHISRIEGIRGDFRQEFEIEFHTLEERNKRVEEIQKKYKFDSVNFIPTSEWPENIEEEEFISEELMKTKKESKEEVMEETTIIKLEEKEKKELREELKKEGVFEVDVNANPIRRTVEMFRENKKWKDFRSMHEAENLLKIWAAAGNNIEVENLVEKRLKLLLNAEDFGWDYVLKRMELKKHNVKLTDEKEMEMKMEALKLRKTYKRKTKFIGTPKPEDTCFKCGKKGHWANNCFAKIKGEKKN